MKNLHKTLLFTILICLISIIFIAYIQITGQDTIVVNASYLDPFMIDILAFIISLFFIIEGFYRIYEHPQAKLIKQVTRSLRIAFGFGILTTHIIQFFYKTLPGF